MTDLVDFDDLFAEQFLEANNHYRKQHSVPELQLSTGLSIEAHQWAEVLAERRHLAYREVPENITFFPVHMTPTEICNYWYKEGRWYEYDTPGWQLGTNYFTQTVWRKTEEVGVGTAIVPSLLRKLSKTGEMVPDPLNEHQVVVAFFRPSGNSNGAGHFASNVSPPFHESLNVRNNHR